MTGTEDDPRARLMAAFRPRFARIAGALTGSVITLGCFVIALTTNGPDVDPRQRVAIAIFGLLCGSFVLTLVSVSARVSPERLRVRNIVRVRSLAWPQIVGLRFGAGDPWVTLDLADGTTLAVMAIQRADGPRGVREANRLAHLVELYGEASEEPSEEP